jgi:solute carrier family 25 S-adenosylmethionine transporter 26
MYPIDTIKTRLQLSQPIALQNNLFRGVSSSLVGQVPYAVLTFGGYEVYKQSLTKRYPNLPKLIIYTTAAVLGDITGSAWLCPSEVIKQNLQGNKYPSVSKAVSGIMSTEGWSGFYRGYVGNIARDVPFRVLQMCSFELTKAAALRIKARRVRARSRGKLSAAPVALSNKEAVMCGVISGTFSAALTTPLDKIKTLLMTSQCTSYEQCVRSIIEREGKRGLMGGFAPRVALIAPSVGIFFVVKEAVEREIDRRDKIQKGGRK